MAGVVALGVAAVAHFYFRYPSLLVHFHVLFGGAHGGLSRHHRAVGGHGAFVQSLVAFRWSGRIFCRGDFRRHASVEGLQAAQCGRARRLGLYEFRLKVHALHLDFVQFKRCGVALLVFLGEGGQEFVGVLAPFLEYGLLFVQVDEVKAEVLGLQQYVAPRRLVFHVAHVALQAVGLLARAVQCGEVEPLADHKLRAGYAALLLVEEGAVFHRKSFEVVHLLRFKMRRLVAFLGSFQFHVVLFHAAQHVVYSLRRGGCRCQQRRDE